VGGAVRIDCAEAEEFGMEKVSEEEKAALLDMLKVTKPEDRMIKSKWMKKWALPDLSRYCRQLIRLGG
jgi:hypothetical protein